MKKVDKPLHYNILTLSLTTARSDEKIPIKADTLTVLKFDGVDASIKLNARGGDSIDLTMVQGVASPFDCFFLTHTAQSGKELVLAIGGEASFEIKGYNPKPTPYTDRTTTATTSTNSFVSLGTWWVADITKALITVRETGTTNGITYQIEGSMDNTNYKVLKLDGGVVERAVVAGGFEYETIVELWKYLRVSIKSTVGGSHGVGVADLHGERM